MEILWRDFYTPDNHLKKNVDILKNLRDSSSSNDQDTAIAATLTYSRLGYFEDTLPILKRALKSKALKKNDYAGELAHLIWFAKPAEQKILVSELFDSDSNYAAEILANYFSDDNYREKLNVALKTHLLAYLSRHEPKLSTTIGEYSIFESLAYSEWLHAVAILTNDTQPERYDRVIMQYIGQITSNPKKTIAYLSSEQGRKFLSEATVSDTTLLLDKIGRFADNLPYPQSPVVLDLVNDIKHHQSSP